MTLQEVLTHFNGVKGSGTQFYALCPNHDDKRQSLSISEQGGKILMNCQAGCKFEDVVWAAGLQMTDLFSSQPDKPEKKPHAKIVATYSYHDADGKLLAQKLRKEDKSFSWRHAGEDGSWIWKKPPHTIPPYNLPAVIAADTVYVAEGEKDADTLKAYGMAATTGADGAGPGKWRQHYNEWFRGKTVVIFQDNDDVGRAFAIETANALKPVARSVKLIDLTRVAPTLNEHGDVSDYLDIMKKRGMAEIEQLIADTPEYEAQEPPKPKKLKIIRMAEIEAKKAEYLLYPYLPKGKLTIVAGISGSTKTWLTLEWASTVSRGREFITDDELTPQRNAAIVIYQTKENDYETDVRPRLDKLDANLENILVIDDHDEDGNGFPLSLTDGRIEEAADEYRPALIIFDPIQSFLSEEIDMNKVNAVRRVLDKLIDIAKNHNCAVILVSHMSKDTTKSALDRILGSSDFRNAARSIVVVGSDPNAADYPHTRVAVHAKNSLGRAGQSIKYHINDYEGVVYDGFCDIDEDAAVRLPIERQTRNKPAVTLTTAMQSLEELLGDDGYFTLEQMDTLKTLSGLSDGTLHKARAELALQRVSIGKPPSRKTWWLSPTVDAEKFKFDHTPPPEQKTLL